MSASTETATPQTGQSKQPEADWSDERQAFYGSGVLNRTASDVAGISQRLRVTTDEDGRQVKLSPGSAEIHGKFYRNTATTAVPVPSNSTGEDRIDHIVVRLNETAHSCGVQCLAGTPGDSNPPPLSWGENGLYDVPLRIITARAGFTSVLDSDLGASYGMWANADSGWVDYDWGYEVLSGPEASIQTDTSAFARYRLVGNTCYVAWRRLTYVTNGESGYDYGVTLPILPAYVGSYIGGGSIQNTQGTVYLLQSGESGMASLRKCVAGVQADVSGTLTNLGTLTHESTTYDSFGCVYEADPSALPVG